MMRCVSRLPIENNAVGILGLPFCFLIDKIQIVKVQTLEGALQLGSRANQSLTSVLTLATPAYWFFLAGFPLAGAIGGSALIIAIGIWGHIFLRHVLRIQTESFSPSFWILGPGLVMGPLVLLAIRFVSTREIFLTLFLVVPILYVTKKGFEVRRGSSRAPVVEAPNVVLNFGLVGGCLMGGFGKWQWPIVVVLITATLGQVGTIRRFRIAAHPLCLGLFLIPIGVVVRNWLQANWFRQAEGVPYDEVVLEALAHGLVNWGPTVNPMQSALDGAASSAYHHLLYLSVGIVDNFLNRPSYETLLVAGPIISATAISSSLILLTCNIFQSSKLGRLVQFSLFAIVFALNGPGFSSLSTTFGIASLLVTLLLLPQEIVAGSFLRNAALIASLIFLVAFSKGPFIYVPLAVTLAHMSYRRPGRDWGLGLVAIVISLLLTWWFSAVSSVANTSTLNFWPENRLGSFSMGLYGLRVVNQEFLGGLATGVACTAILAFARKSRKQCRFFLSLVLLMLIATITKLFLDDPYQGFAYAYIPGIFASLMLPLVVISLRKHDSATETPTYRKLAVISSILLVLLVSVLKVFGLHLQEYVPAATIFGVVLVFCSRVVHRRVRFFFSEVVQVKNILFISLPIIFGLSAIADFAQLYRSDRKVETSSEDWEGSRQFKEAAAYIRNQTPLKALFATTICSKAQFEIESVCVADLRTAALTRRQFLSLGPVFRGQQLSAEGKSDLAVVQLLGVKPASEVLVKLANRGVTHLLLVQASMIDDWHDLQSCTGVDEVFSNEEYRVFEIDSKFAGCST